MIIGKLLTLKILWVSTFILLFVFAGNCSAARYLSAGSADGYVGETGAESAAYTETRDDTTGDTNDTAIMRVGQYESGNYFYLYRGYVSFAIPQMASVSACSLYIDGTTDNSGVDFGVYLLSSAASKPTIDVTDFTAFDGWQASGAYNGAVLNEAWNSSSFTTDWNVIAFNSAGLDSILATEGDSLRIAIISAEDYNSSEPGDETTEYLRFTTSAGGTIPYLAITYEFPSSGTVNTYAAYNNDGSIGSDHTVYTTARDTGANESVSTTQLTVGQTLSGADYHVWRTFMCFEIPTMASVSAASLFLDGVSNSSTTDFNIYAHTSTYDPTLTTADFDQFDGWQASGAYNGAGLNETWNSNDYSDNWNEIAFNAPGKAAILAAQGDTLWITLLSAEDYNSSLPEDNEYVIFTPSFVAKVDTYPYLTITYGASGWTAGTMNGVSSPATIDEVDIANIASVDEVQ